MKISKTNSNRVNDRKVESVKKSGKGGRSSKATGSAKGSEEDTVSLSADALSVSSANETDEIHAIASIDGPMPDPMETSQAIIEKELKALPSEAKV